MPQQDHSPNTNSAQTTFSALERLGEAIRAQQWTMAKQHGLSPLQLNILLFLNRHRPDLRKHAVLADEFMLTRPTISEATRSLERKKLIFRETDERDSRSSFLHLTAQGEDLARKLDHYPESFVDTIQQIPEQELQALNANLFPLLYQLIQAQLVAPARMCFTCQHYDGNRKDQHQCRLLNQMLSNDLLRLDCPEHEAA